MKRFVSGVANSASSMPIDCVADVRGLGHKWQMDKVFLTIKGKEATMMVRETHVRETGGVATASLGLNPWSGERGLFCKEGEYWTLGYAGTLWRLKDMRGLAYIAQLLRAPATAFHVLDLVRGSATSADAREYGGAAFGSEGQVREAELPVGTLGDAGAWLGEQAK